MEQIYKKMFISQILVHVCHSPKKLETKTRTSKLRFPKFMSRLTAYLEKKNNEDPKYLKGD